MDDRFRHMADQFKQRIGSALVAESVIDVKQLKASLEYQNKNKRFCLGQIVSIRYSVPAEVVDDVCLRQIAMPRFTPALFERLAGLAEKDRFARNLDLGVFIRNIEARALSCEVETVERHGLTADSGKASKTNFQRNVIMKIVANVSITSATRDNFPLVVNAIFEGAERRLRIVERDDQLRDLVYNELKYLYKQRKGSQEGQARVEIE